MTLESILNKSGFAARELMATLDELSPTERRRQALSLSRGAQKRLFDAAKDLRPIALDHLVPEDAPPLKEVVHEGLNTLPTFRHFAKVFCRMQSRDKMLAGYNRTRPLIATTVGPGYFVARDHEEPGELLVDYLTLPEEKPSHWPEILPNSSRLSRFVYNGTQDVLRGVTSEFSIGRAMKGGKWLPAWFVLYRV